MTETRQDFFVSAACVAGRLHAVMKIAKDVSLAAKNAKAISTRAGEKASGFKPITDFIDELARETIDLVATINIQGLKVSRDAVAELRSLDAYQRFENVVRRLPADNTDRHLQSSIDSIKAELDRHQSNVHNHTRYLIELLDRIATCMRAAVIITTRSRVEAARTEEYQLSLEVVSAKIEDASNEIKAAVHECKTILSVPCLRKN